MKIESNIYLKEVLQLDIFNKSNLIAGNNGTGNVISSINVMLDNQIMNWVTTEEQMILTTGQMLDDISIKEMVEIFKYLSEKKVSAVFIKINPYIDQLPKEIIDSCDELSLPVVAIPFETTFTDAIAAVYGLIHQKQTNLLNRVEDLHKDTMKIVTSGGKTKDILQSLNKTIKGPVFIRDYYFEDTFYMKTNFEKEYQANFEDIEKVHYGEKDLKIIWDKVKQGDKEVHRMIVPIIVKNLPLGHIIAYNEDEVFSNYDKLGLESTSNIIALEFLNRLSLQELDNKYKVEFFEDLISTDEMRRNKAVERASNYRFMEHAKYAVLSIGILAREGKDITTEDYHKVVYLTDLICKDRGRPYLILNKGEETHLLIMLKDQENKIIIERYAKYIYDVLTNKLKKFDIYIGCGRIYKGLAEVVKCVKDAEKALLGARKYREENIVFFEEMGFYKILSQDNLDKELKTFYKEVLESLDIYDAKKDTELIRTLEYYFECNGNLKKMSEKLYTHYNTILYRMNRIEDITKLKLDDEEERFSLQMALKIRKILY